MFATLWLSLEDTEYSGPVKILLVFYRGDLVLKEVCLNSCFWKCEGECFHCMAEQVFNVVDFKMLLCTTDPPFRLPSVVSGTVAPGFPFRKHIFLGITVISQTQCFKGGNYCVLKLFPAVQRFRLHKQCQTG